MKRIMKMIALTLCLTLATAAQAAMLRSPRYSRRYAQAQPAQSTQPQNMAEGSWRDSNASEVVRQVNAERAKAGLKSLRADEELTRAAQVRATEIVLKFSHTRPDGSAWSTVSSSAFGENIAVGQQTPDKVMAAWLTSSGHRANILRTTYGSIGVACYVSGGVTYWVQLFGK